jgi:hypothetical protein
MKISPYIRILVTAIVVGAGVGFLCSFLVGLYLMASYHKQGPNDPTDAPAMLAMGLMLIAVCLGAIVGLTVGVIFCVRLARRKPSIQPI